MKNRSERLAVLHHIVVAEGRRRVNGISIAPVLLIVSLFLSSNPLGGQSDVIQLEAYTVTATRERQKVYEVPTEALDEVSEQLHARRVSDASKRLAECPTVLSRTLTTALKKARPDQTDANKEKIETALVEALEGEENAVGQWINYLNVVAAVSPMIGLLGTVSGMIGAFQTIAHGGMGRPELLAGDIGEALITTATGLVIGIPAMIAYFILRNRLNNLMLATTQTASLLIDYLAGEVEYKKEDQG